MAARSFTRESLGTLQRDVVKLWLKCVGAGAGNPTGTFSAGAGAAITYRAATGKYRVTLADNYKRLLNLVGNVIDPTGVDDWEVVVEADLSSKVIDIAVFKGGALTDLTADETLMLEITLSNCSFQG